MKNRSFLITGGTGTFGSAFAQKLLENKLTRRLVIFSRDEYKQFRLKKKFDSLGFSDVRFFLGDIRDFSRLKSAFRNIDIVIHAAALKQVPSAEYNPFEYVKTNIIGAENIVNAAIESDVEKVIALSTDKAVNPINLYGATKLASDKIFVSGNNLAGRIRTRFSVVRYGNVINSRGSVIPFFCDLIKKKSLYLPITDKRMTRFFISIDQAVDFVLNSLEIMIGGEIFVPKIPSVKIIDLARSFSKSIQLRIIGIRPGEKIHEIMITPDDSANTYDIGHCYVIEPPRIFWAADRKDPLRRFSKKHVKKVVTDFYYSSENNTDWLRGEKLRELIKKFTDLKQ